MSESQPSLLARDDTFFGICEALGEDFGFNPLYLRATLAVLLLWNPVAVFATYAGLGVVVGISRWAFPKPRPAGAVQMLVTHQGSRIGAPATAQHEATAQGLAMAA